MPKFLDVTDPAKARLALGVTNTAVNVLSYGAKGDGIADDTSAIHAARDAAGVGGTVIIPPGTYITTGVTLSVTSQIFNIMPGATIKTKNQSYSSQHNTITVSAANVTITGGGAVDGNRSSLGNNAANVIAVITGTVASTDLTIENITVKNSSFFGVWGQASRTKVMGCTLTGHWAVPIMLSSYYLAVVLGSTMQDTYDMEASDNYIDRSNENPATVNYAAIQIRGNGDPAGTPHVTYRGKALRNTILMPLNPAETTGYVCGIEFGAQSYYALAEGNMIVNGTMGISFAKGNYGKAIGNTLIGQTLYAIEIAASVGCTIQANVIDGAGRLGSTGGAGITTNSGNVSTDASIVGNRIFGINDNSRALAINGLRASVSGNCIEALRGITATAITDSTFSGNIFLGKGYGYGVGLINCSSVVISGNSMKDQGQGVLINSSSGTSDHINVSSNHFRLCTTAVDGTTSGGGAIGTNIINANNIVRAS